MAEGMSIQHSLICESIPFSIYASAYRKDQHSVIIVSRETLSIILSILQLKYFFICVTYLLNGVP